MVSRTGAELWRAWGDVTLLLGLAIGALVFRRFRVRMHATAV